MSGNYDLTDINARHLSAGESLPPISNKKLTVYNMRFCPYAQRVILVLYAKSIPFNVINVNLKEKPEWLFEKNPSGKVPIVEMDEGKILYESLIISDYLDEMYSTSLYSKTDPYRKAKDRLLIETFNLVISSYYRLISVKKEEKMTEESRTELIRRFNDTLMALESDLKNRDTKYFGGGEEDSKEEPKMVDLMIWPWFERIPVLKTFYPETEINEFKYPNLVRWIRNMKDVPYIQKYLISEENHLKYIQSMLAGTPDYEMLNKMTL